MTIEPSALPPALAAQLPHYRLLPAALLGRLAVASQYRGQRMGERLLADAIHRVSTADIAAMAIVVDAIDEPAAAFYQHFGFVPFTTTPMRLYLILAQVRGHFSHSICARWLQPVFAHLFQPRAT
ncbi:MAG: GNAT family N-acetyltransferase [Dehalococcoidia bacterium]